MCRNITILRGLQPPATEEEVRAAALQYVRKVGGISAVSGSTHDAVARAVESVARATMSLLRELPERRVVPVSEPPLRRIGRQAREVR